MERRKKSNGEKEEIKWREGRNQMERRKKSNGEKEEIKCRKRKNKYRALENIHRNPKVAVLFLNFVMDHYSSQ